MSVENGSWWLSEESRSCWVHLQQVSSSLFVSQYYYAYSTGDSVPFTNPHHHSSSIELVGVPAAARVGQTMVLIA